MAFVKIKDQTFPDRCPRCNAMERYDHTVQQILGIRYGGETTFGCGLTVERRRASDLDGVEEELRGRCKNERFRAHES